VRFARMRRRHGQRKVGHVVPDPLAGGDRLTGLGIGRVHEMRIPPHPALALAPRVAVQVGGGAIVDDAPISRPRPPQLQVGRGLESACAVVRGFARLGENQMSVRQSPGALAAMECHCSMRWVLVKLPSYSAIWVEGKKKISVLMSAVFTSPLFTSGARYQYVAVSVSQLSFTTSQSSCRSARRVAVPLSDVAGFCPTQHIPFT